MKTFMLSIIAYALCITLLIPDVDARHGGGRPRFNKCDAVGLNLEPISVDLLAGDKNYKVGTVDLSTRNGKLFTKVKVIHGCSLAGFVKVNIYPVNSLSSLSKGRSPCSAFAYQKMKTLSCPIKKFTSIVDCCAEHFVIVFVAIVKCGRHPKTLAYVGDGDNKYVSVKLLPGCKGNGCLRYTPFTEVCMNNKCDKVEKPPCKDRCDGNKPIESECSEGECIDTPQAPCEDKCDMNTPVISTCLEGTCVEMRKEPCKDMCDGNTAVSSTCVAGMCKTTETPCKDKCDGNKPIFSECSDGECVEKPQAPCENKCDKDIPIWSTCVDGKCKETRKEPCKDMCDGNTAVSSTCVDGMCKTTETPCKSRCDRNKPIMSICKEGKCVEEGKPPCKSRCERNKLIISKCMDGKCEETVTSCGKCGVCRMRGKGGRGPMCKQPRCGRRKVLNERFCKCCPVCRKQYVHVVRRGRCKCVYKH